MRHARLRDYTAIKMQRIIADCGFDVAVIVLCATARFLVPINSPDEFLAVSYPEEIASD